MDKVIQETNHYGKATNTSIEDAKFDIVDEELKLSEKYQLKHTIGKKKGSTLLTKDFNPLNILVKNQSGYDYTLEKYKVSTRKTVKVPLTLSATAPNPNEKSRYRASSSLSTKTRNPRLVNSIMDTYLVY